MIPWPCVVHRPFALGRAANYSTTTGWLFRITLALRPGLKRDDAPLQDEAHGVACVIRSVLRSAGNLLHSKKWLVYRPNHRSRWLPRPGL